MFVIKLNYLVLKSGNHLRLLCLLLFEHRQVLAISNTLLADLVISYLNLGQLDFKFKVLLLNVALSGNKLLQLCLVQFLDILSLDLNLFAIVQMLFHLCEKDLNLPYFIAVLELLSKSVCA